MNIQRIYTKKIMGLDTSVWILMVPLIAVSLLLLGYKLANKKECIPVAITVKGINISGNGVFSTEETLSFSASVKTQNIEWDFGDNSAVEAGQYVTHRFKKEGKYFVTAGVGKGCKTVKEINVENPPKVELAAEGTDSKEKIIGRNSTFVGVQEVYVCATVGQTYDWVVENYPAIKPESLGSIAKMRFVNPGKYTLTVTVDNDREKRYSKEIIVSQAEITQSATPENIPRLLPAAPSIPSGPPPVLIRPSDVSPKEKPAAATAAPATPPEAAPVADAPKFKILGNATFKAYLEKLSDGEMDVSDFDKYLCGGSGTKVIVNNNRKEMQTFAQFCKFLTEKKKKKALVFNKPKTKVTSVLLHRDEGNCVTLIDIGVD